MQALSNVECSFGGKLGHCGFAGRRWNFWVWHRLGRGEFAEIYVGNGTMDSRRWEKLSWSSGPCGEIGGGRGGVRIIRVVQRCEGTL
jgi:hypothetical protein